MVYVYSDLGGVLGGFVILGGIARNWGSVYIALVVFVGALKMMTLLRMRGAYGSDQLRRNSGNKITPTPRLHPIL